MPSSSAKAPCSTCSAPWTEEAFYANCLECKACKRARSKRNRALQARKIAAFERFVDVLVGLTVRADMHNEYPSRRAAS
jgi:hypothetical protein